MRKNAKRWLGVFMVVVLVMVALATLGGCGSQNSLVGVWQDTWEEIEFNANGTGIWGNERFTWSSSQGRITFRFDGQNQPEIYYYELTGDNNRLRLSDCGEFFDTFSRVG